MSLVDLCDSDTVVAVDSDTDTLVAVDAATIEDEDEDASLGEIASHATQTPALSHDASTKVSACLQDPATETEPAAGCLHGLRRLVGRVLAPLRRTSEPRMKKRKEVAPHVREFGGNVQSYTLVCNDFELLCVRRSKYRKGSKN